MIHENPGHLFRSEFAHRFPGPDDCALCYRERDVLLIGGELPRFGQLSAALDSVQYLFELDGRGYFLAEPDDIGSVPGAQMASIDQFRYTEPQHLGFAGITGSQLHRFYRDNVFCGRCGARMRKSEAERALCCPDCANTVYPRISPAVIVAVTDGDRLLLTKYAGRANARYALVAGFCECGEPVEQTVRREVMEEVGLRIRNIRYYSSQPWSFSDSLLLGFYCDVDGDVQAKVDGVELCEATWFRRDEIPPPDSLASLTATMIDAFRTGRYADERACHCGRDGR